MKKALFVLLAVFAVAGFALAQIGAAPSTDVLGAHLNYGRGCAGCHAPHSGAWGAGGNAKSGTVSDAYTGSNALFAQDMGPLWGQTFDFSDVSNTAPRTPIYW